jgi:hypothetical protein
MFILKGTLFAVLLSLFLGFVLGKLATIGTTDHAHAVFPSWLVYMVVITFLGSIGGIMAAIILKINAQEQLQKVLIFSALGNFVGLLFMWLWLR